MLGFRSSEEKRTSKIEHRKSNIETENGKTATTTGRKSN
jgi:hypothetical protein